MERFAKVPLVCSLEWNYGDYRSPLPLPLTGRLDMVFSTRILDLFARHDLVGLVVSPSKDNAVHE